MNNRNKAVLMSVYSHNAVRAHSKCFEFVTVLNASVHLEAINVWPNINKMSFHMRVWHITLTNKLNYLAFKVFRSECLGNFHNTFETSGKVQWRISLKLNQCVKATQDLCWNTIPQKRRMYMTHKMWQKRSECSMLEVNA